MYIFVPYMEVILCGQIIRAVRGLAGVACNHEIDLVRTLFQCITGQTVNTLAPVIKHGPVTHIRVRFMGDSAHGPALQVVLNHAAMAQALGLEAVLAHHQDMAA